MARLLRPQGGSIQVGGDTFLKAARNGKPGEVILTNKANNFGGKLNVDADHFDIDDQDGRLNFDSVHSPATTGMLRQSTSGAVRDTNTRYTTETNSGTGIQNVVQRYGQQWMAQRTQWLFGGQTAAMPTITADSVQTVGSDVFLKPTGNTDESDTPANISGRTTSTPEETSVR